MVTAPTSWTELERRRGRSLVQSVTVGSMASWTRSSRCRGSALGELDVGASTGSGGEVLSEGAVTMGLRGHDRCCRRWRRRGGSASRQKLDEDALRGAVLAARARCAWSGRGWCRSLSAWRRTTTSGLRVRRGEGEADTALRGWAPARRGGINAEEGGSRPGAGGLVVGRRGRGAPAGAWRAVLLGKETAAAGNGAESGGGHGFYSAML